MRRTLDRISALTIFAFGLCVAVGTAAAGEREEDVRKVTMRTPWGEKVAADNVWQEYPRPALRRENWSNLNGHWQYAVTKKDQEEKPATWEGKILVPFAIEAPLSGVERHFGPEDALWYERSLVTQKKPNLRYRLNFEAVDYEATLWVNGKVIGSHVGGNQPFSFDITDALTDGTNTITLRVTDASDTPTAFQLHGKQRLHPEGIWYTPVSGIWQTVWLEEVPQASIASLKITPKLTGEVTIEIGVQGGAAQGPATVVATLDGREVARAEGNPREIKLSIPEPKLWSPSSPTLYDLRIELGDDVVESYFGIREVGKVRDEDGHWRLTLNGKPIFHFGPLDQGWWPDGLLTPPSDEALRSDIEFLKAAGFNTIRKHIKIEPRRFYYHCDRLGMMLWQDQVSFHSESVDPKWTRLQPDPTDGKWPTAAHEQYMAELKGMIDGLYSHPSIVLWVPFNEAWGQHQSVEVGKWTSEYDKTRLVNLASGGNFWPAGDIVDHHQYPHPAFPFERGKGKRFEDFIMVVGEFGGHGYPVEGHVWDPRTRNWGYGSLPKNKEEWLGRYQTSIRMLADLKKKGIAAGIYTQTTDVEGEINGLLTYDRKVHKLPAEKLAEIHRSAGLVD